jgi:hypothetical protein
MRVSVAFPILLGFALAAVALPASADDAPDAPFGTVYTTTLEPQGETEVEQWLSWKSGKAHEDFDAIEGRTEIEYGVSDKFQIAAYANYEWSRTRAHPIVGPAETSTKFTGFSAEAIYQLLNPSTDLIGLALYLEPRIGPGTRELETKILLQKNLLDDRLILAANIVLEHEWNLQPADPTAPPGSRQSTRYWAKNTEFNLLAGASYRVAEDWYAGVEFASQREYDGLVLFEHNSAAANSFFAGPTLHFAEDEWWVTLSAQAQLPWAMNLGGAPGEVVNHFAHEEERYRLILRTGFDL